MSHKSQKESRCIVVKITVAVDSMKGSLSSVQAGEAICEGIRRVLPDALVRICPIADGGEGIVDALLSAAGGITKSTTATNPLGLPTEAVYGIIPHTKTAIIEVAAATGLTLIDDSDKNPLYTTTYGVGELILDAISSGCRHYIIGLGGSATNDGGVGMLQALGYEFLDQSGNQIPFGAKGLAQMVTIREQNRVAELSECTFLVACDVTNPLCGEHGASAVYGPQKGAAPDTIPKMDQGLSHYAHLTKALHPSADETAPGAGAAGGLGFAFLSYLNARLMSGIDLVIQQSGLENMIKDADLVITGEGKLDGQSFQGKAPIGIAKLAKRYGKPVIAFSGSAGQDATICNEHGIDAFFPIIRTPCSLDDAMKHAPSNLANTVEQVFRLITAILK